MRAQRGAWWCLFLSLAGIGVAGFLTYLHLGLMRGELVGGAACGGGGAFNCHAVTASSWGSFLGMPLALWGLMGYVVVFGLSLLARQSADMAGHALTAITVLALAFVAIDLVLLTVMLVVIRLFCSLCFVSYGINVALLVVAARALERPLLQTIQRAGAAFREVLPSARQPATWLFWGLVVTGAAAAVSLHVTSLYMSQGSLGGLQKQVREFVGRQQARVSVDVAGDPRIGEAAAPLQIIEFSDLFCPACQRASKLNTVILANHRGDASFVFKHFPLDTACNSTVQRNVHPGACRAAAALECAHLQGMFWPLHDVIFEHGHDYKLAHLETDARHLGLDVPKFQACLASGRGMEAVKRDVAEGGKIGVSSTPTYLINGLRVPGMLSPSTFDAFADVLRESGAR